MRVVVSKWLNKCSGSHALLRSLVLSALAVGVGITFTPANAETLRIASWAQSGPDINGHYTYTYTVDFTGPAFLSTPASSNDQWAPDFLEVFDFAGFVPGSMVYTPAPAGPTNLANNNFTTALVLGQDTLAETALLPLALAVDDPNIDNLKINYADIGASNPGVAPLTVGTLSAKSIYGTIIADWYLSTETLTGGFSGINLSGTVVPVPEPSSVALVLAFAALARPRRRRN